MPAAAPATRRRAGGALLRGDDRLVAHLRAGDERAFEVLYDRYHRGLLGFCRHMLGSRHEAEDALQHTLLSAFRALRDGEDTGELRLKPWLYAIARNRCLSTLRSRREATDVDDVVLATEGLSAQVTRRADLQALVEDVRGLPEDQRAALVLFELGDVSHDEIAQVLGVRRDKVKALVFQAREALMAARTARETPCAEIREQLAALTGSALRRAPIRRHVAICTGCREFEQEVRAQRAALAIALPVVPAAGLKAGVLSGLGGGGGTAAAAVLAGGGAGGVAGGSIFAGVGAKAAAVLAVVAAAGTTGALTVAEVREEVPRSEQPRLVREAPVEVPRTAQTLPATPGVPVATSGPGSALAASSGGAGGSGAAGAAAAGAGATGRDARSAAETRREDRKAAKDARADAAPGAKQERQAAKAAAKEDRREARAAAKAERGAAKQQRRAARPRGASGSAPGARRRAAPARRATPVRPARRGARPAVPARPDTAASRSRKGTRPRSGLGAAAKPPKADAPAVPKVEQAKRDK